MATQAKKKKAAKKSPRKWSARVTRTSNALDLKKDVFKGRSAEAIARSLKHSAEKSKRKKGTPYQSAMSMLNFYLNRAGKNLSASRKKILNHAKGELRKAFHREKPR
jgi:hypothetical protein